MTLETNLWGTDKLAAIVTDNAANMVVTRSLVQRAFKHMVKVRSSLKTGQHN